MRVKVLNRFFALFLGSLLLASCGAGRGVAENPTKYERGERACSDSLFQMGKTGDSLGSILPTDQIRLWSSLDSTILTPEPDQTTPDTLSSKEKRQQRRDANKAERKDRRGNRRKDRRDYTLDKLERKYTARNDRKRIKSSGRTDREIVKQDAKTDRKEVKESGRTDRSKERTNRKGERKKLPPAFWWLLILLITFAIIAVFGKKLYNKYVK